MTAPGMETHPCATCGVPLTAPADGKMHHCDACWELAARRADEFWAVMGVQAPTIDDGRRR